VRPTASRRAGRTGGGGEAGGAGKARDATPQRRATLEKALTQLAYSDFGEDTGPSSSLFAMVRSWRRPVPHRPSTWPRTTPALPGHAADPLAVGAPPASPFPGAVVDIVGRCPHLRPRCTRSRTGPLHPLRGHIVPYLRDFAELGHSGEIIVLDREGTPITDLRSGPELARRR